MAQIKSKSFLFLQLLQCRLQTLRMEFSLQLPGSELWLTVQREKKLSGACLIALWQLHLWFVSHMPLWKRELKNIMWSIPQFQPDQGFIPHSIYFFPLLPCYCQSPLAFFTVLCVAVRAKVTCLAIDCILPHWFPYEIGSSTSLWLHGRVQHLMLPANVFSDCRGLRQNKTILMKAWRHLSGYHPPRDKSEIQRVSSVVYRCFRSGWPWEAEPMFHFCLTYCRKWVELYSALHCPSTKWLFFLGWHFQLWVCIPAGTFSVPL